MKNNRTFLEKLLDGAEVEWIPLGDVADYEQPTKYLVNSTVYNDNYPTPVLTAGKTFILGYTNEDEGIYFASKSPVIIFDDFTTANKWVDFDFKAKSSAMKMITSKNEKFALLKYIYYWLNTLPNNQIDSDHKRQWISNYANKLIPIPPLPVQTEIVKILDALTELTSELTSELILRRKQYEYYREKLLSEEELGKVGFEWRALKDILIRTKGTKITAAEMKVLHKENAPLKIFAGGKTFALVNYSDIPEKDINKNPSIIVKSRGFIEFEYYDKPFSHKNEMWSYYSNDKNINIKYIYYVLKNQEPYFQNLGSKMQMPQISTPDTDRYLVPIPPPYIQTEIVKILDKFESLTNSITEGLPLAIEQSQKRYEYYRELLLNFPGRE